MFQLYTSRAVICCWRGVKHRAVIDSHLGSPFKTRFRGPAEPVVTPSISFAD
jgi:hypothetical protein